MERGGKLGVDGTGRDKICLQLYLRAWASLSVGISLPEKLCLRGGKDKRSLMSALTSSSQQFGAKRQLCLVSYLLLTGSFLVKISGDGEEWKWIEQHNQSGITLNSK